MTGHAIEIVNDSMNNLVMNVMNIIINMKFMTARFYLDDVEDNFIDEVIESQRDFYVNFNDESYFRIDDLFIDLIEKNTIKLFKKIK